MPVAELPLGEWLPDAPSFKNPGCEVLDNAIPVTGGYNPLPSLVGQEDTVGGAVFGAAQLFDNSGNSIIVGGTDDSLFIRRATITETTGLTSIGAGQAWDFAQFNDFVVATAPNNNPKALTDIDSDDSWSDLGGSPPQAKVCAKVGDFLMLGAISGAPNRIQWSHFNSPAGSWTPDRLTQAGYVDLPAEYGEVQRIVGGRYATVFQKRGISRISYVGPPQVWRADDISKDRGAVAPFAVVSVGYLTYFLAQDGFYVTNGASVEPLGSRRVNRWFLQNVSQGNIARVHGAVDWQNECIVWAFISENATDYDRLMIYSWSQDRWTSGTANVGWLVGTALDGVTLEDLDALYSTLEAVPYSLDSAEFAPKDRRLGAFAAGEYSVFSGSPLELTVRTGEAQLTPGRRVFASEVYPIMQADEWDASVRLYCRNNRGTVTATNAVVTGWSGFSAVRGEGQKMAIEMTKPAGTEWSEMQGFQVRFREAGYR